MSIFQKISFAGLVVTIIGIGLLCVSVGDTITSFRAPLDFEDLLDEEPAPGAHVKGEVFLLLDSFATEQTWTENRSTNSRTAAKTSHGYYVLPCYNGNIALSVAAANISTAARLVDQTYGYLEDGAIPTSTLTVDGRVTRLTGELADYYWAEMLEYYGYTEEEIEEMGGFLLIESRDFLAIRIFCGTGAVFLIVGILLLLGKWRRVSALFPEEEGLGQDDLSATMDS